MIDTRYNTVKLFFEEKEHKYTDTLGNTYTSCTTLLHKYKPAFNRDYWIKKKAAELNVSTKEIAKRWSDITEESCDRGNSKHNYLENGIKDVSRFKDAVKYLTELKSGQMITVADIPNLIGVKQLDIEQFKIATENKYPEIYNVFDYYIQQGYTIYSEIGIFLIDYLISGTIDVLCIRPDRFVILDWKTNKDGLKFESGYYRKDKSSHPYQLTNEWVPKDNCLLAPVSNLPDCNGSIYSLQLSNYALMVEMVLGIPCVGLGLCHIGSPFILNKYGMPLASERGGYTIDETKPDIVNWYRINYYKRECQYILNDHLVNIESTKKSQYKLNL